MFRKAHEIWLATTGSLIKSIFAGAWRRRGHPEDGLVDPGVGPFGSVLGSRSVLDAVVEEEMSEDDEDSIAVIADPNDNNGQATAIIVHSRSSSSSNSQSSRSSFKNLDVWQWSKIIIFKKEEKFEKPYQQSLLKDINYKNLIKLILN